MTDDVILFDRRIAEKYGVNEAVFICKIWGWVKYNAQNNRNYINGKYWTYNSTKAYVEQFPFWSKDQINHIIKKLLNLDIIQKDTFNELPFDRTSWYTFSDNGLEVMGDFGYTLYGFSENTNSDFVNPQNLISQKSESNTNNIPIEETRNEGKPSCISFDEIKNLWNEKCSMLPSISIVSTTRQNKIRTRFKEFEAVGEPMDVLKILLDKIANSHFLTVESRDNWRKKLFDWLFDNSQNWVKVWEGRYDDNCGTLFSTQQNDKSNTSAWGTKYE